VLPCIALTFYNLSSYVRYIRSNTISQLSADYVQTACLRRDAFQYSVPPRAEKRVVAGDHPVRPVVR